MKTRSGFVSNSSSSSFVIFGKKLDWSEVMTDAEVWMLGTMVGEGWDVFQLTDDMKLAIVEKERQGEYYLAYKTLWPEEEVPMKRDELPPEFTVYEFERSQHSVSSLATFRERYLKK